ncbi:MAG: hypothetical protein HKP48_07825 [Winogradskyella sp.]|uniref:DUF6452 family protein n=1 Tax=Winogradskyella sp. TaxID=1883156 RepID=UPI0017DF4C93|nr:DUF6452 family protein [Winogradskyella sp.]MBT8244186.1 hypothetical protein [Winogradskyella sp.]NNK23189.1 hypothetical protein [Winogradskyella sp.]
MRFYKFSILFLALLFLGCERDDICAEGTPTTPRLLIEFFDATDTDIVKNVPRLSVYADDPSITTPTNENTSGAILVEPFGTERVFNRNSNAAGLPFLLGAEDEFITLRYFFEKDTNLRLVDDTSTNSNIDVVEITYKPEFVYVSRACGFKSIVTELEIEVIDDGDNWIQNLSFSNTIEQSITVENEDETHVQIFH